MDYKRIGIIFVLVLAVVAITSFGGPHSVKPIQVQVVSAQSGGGDAGCTGCSTDMWCYQCHAMNYQPNPYDPSNCVQCNYYPDGSPIITGKLSKQSFRDSVTGVKLLMRDGFETKPMRADHAQKAKEFHASAPVACRKKLITE